MWKTFSLLNVEIVKTIVITNNFNTHINFFNFRDFDKKILYLETE